MFREKCIRLITVADGFDSSNGEDDLLPFKDIFAEWHARDTSRKIKAIFQSRTAEGKHVTGSIPYGYLHDPNDRQKWIIDEEAAKVVRYIFRLLIEGHGVFQISKILEREKIPVATIHWESMGIPGGSKRVTDNPYLWQSCTVSNIIKREEYTGKKILRKFTKSSYKDKKKTANPREEQLIFDGTIPQIIDQETFDTAQRLRKTIRRPAKSGEPPYRLTGLLWCKDCGDKMSHRRSMDYRRGKAANEYICSNYRERANECSMHFIRVVVIEEIILDAIRTTSNYVLANKDRFIAEVRVLSKTQAESAIKESRAQSTKLVKRRSELDVLIKKLYESFAVGRIPENHFEKLLAEYDEEYTSLEPKIAELQRQIETFDANSVRAEKFVELVNRYTCFDELTTPMLNEFIQKIIVHEKEGDGRGIKRKQKVEIYFSFIGKYTVPKK